MSTHIDSVSTITGLCFRCRRTISHYRYHDPSFEVTHRLSREGTAEVYQCPLCGAFGVFVSDAPPPITGWNSLEDYDDFYKNR